MEHSVSLFTISDGAFKSCFYFGTGLIFEPLISLDNVVMILYCDSWRQFPTMPCMRSQWDRYANNAERWDANMQGEYDTNLT